MMRTRQWAPLFVLIVTALAAYQGYQQTGHRSWGWTLGGTAVGLVLVLVIDRYRHYQDVMRG